jgi:two-component system chemotaxis response regulator CheY
MRAIIVDDSMAARFRVAEMVRDVGFDVSEAGNGIDALQLLLSGGRFDVAFVDWSMPAMNGLDLITEIRKRNDLAHLRIVMVTAETETHRMIRALEAGADGYLTKPFEREKLLEKLSILGIAVHEG